MKTLELRRAIEPSCCTYLNQNYFDEKQRPTTKNLIFGLRKSQDEKTPKTQKFDSKTVFSFQYTMLRKRRKWQKLKCESLIP